MKLSNRFICLLNAFITIGFVFLIFEYASAIISILGSVLGIAIILLILLTLVIWGTIISYKSMFQNKDKLIMFDKILVIFPIINFLLLLFIIGASIINML